MPGLKWFEDNARDIIWWFIQVPKLLLSMNTWKLMVDLQRQRSPRFVPPACRWGDVGTHFPVPNWWLDLTPILESHLMRFFDSLSKTRKSSICQERLNFLVPAFTFRLISRAVFLPLLRERSGWFSWSNAWLPMSSEKILVEKKHIAVPRSRSQNANGWQALAFLKVTHHESQSCGCLGEGV